MPKINKVHRKIDAYRHYIDKVCDKDIADVSGYKFARYAGYIAEHYQ